MTRTTGLVCLVALLACVGGQHDGAQWQQDQFQQLEGQAQQQEQAYQQVVTGNSAVPDAAAYQDWSQQWAQADPGPGVASATHTEAAVPQSDDRSAYDQLPETLLQQPDDILAIVQELGQQSGHAAAVAASETDPSGGAVTAASSTDSRAAAGDEVSYQYAMYTRWLALQQQQPELGPFWEWLQLQQQHHQQHEQEQVQQQAQQQHEQREQFLEQEHQQELYDPAQADPQPEQHGIVYTESTGVAASKADAGHLLDESTTRASLEAAYEVRATWGDALSHEPSTEQSSEQYAWPQDPPLLQQEQQQSQPAEEHVEQQQQLQQEQETYVYEYATSDAAGEYRNPTPADGVNEPPAADGAVYGAAYGNEYDVTSQQGGASVSAANPTGAPAADGSSAIAGTAGESGAGEAGQCSWEGDCSAPSDDVPETGAAVEPQAADLQQSQQGQQPQQEQQDPQQAVMADVAVDWTLYNVADPVAIAAEAQAAAEAAARAQAAAQAQAAAAERAAAEAVAQAQVAAEAQAAAEAAALVQAPLEAQAAAEVAAQAQAAAELQAAAAERAAAAAAVQAEVAAEAQAVAEAAARAQVAAELQAAATSAPPAAEAAAQSEAAVLSDSESAPGDAAQAPEPISGSQDVQATADAGTVGAGGTSTDAAAAALVAEAAAASAEGGHGAAPRNATAAAGDEGGGPSAETREEAQTAAEAAGQALEKPPEKPDLLRGMKVADVQKKLKEAQGLVYANTSRRNMTAGLQELRALHELVEAALPNTVQTRLKFIFPPPPEADAALAEAQQPSSPRPPRPLAQEVAESRLWGLNHAAAATFQLAALQGSGVMPPDVMPYDPMAAALALHQAARAGSMEALMALADRHAQGIGTPASCTRGLLFGKLAAMYLAGEVEKEQRYAPALAPVALRERFADGSYVAAEDAENGAHVISLEEDLAFRGNADAMRRMAYRRLVGRGMEADPEGAFHDFQAAAAQGDPYAIFNIGYMYLRGLHVPQNYTAAKEQFEKAAEKGLPSAHNGLGVLAWNGQGMAPNLTAARQSFERGAALNNSDSVYNLATMHFHGAGTPINQSMALDLFKRAMELGHWRAPYMLALAYEAGAGTEPNCTRAMQYLRVLFADRSTWGQQLTAAVKLLDAGDTRGALLTYITVAEQGSAAAAANAAWLLRRRAGYSGPDADKLAAKYFQRAAKQGHTGSMVELAHMLLAAAPPWIAKPAEEEPVSVAAAAAAAAAEEEVAAEKGTAEAANATSTGAAAGDGDQAKAANAFDGAAAETDEQQKAEGGNGQAAAVVVAEKPAGAEGTSAVAQPSSADATAAPATATSSTAAATAEGSPDTATDTVVKAAAVGSTSAATADGASAATEGAAADAADATAAATAQPASASGNGTSADATDSNSSTNITTTTASRNDTAAGDADAVNATSKSAASGLSEVPPLVSSIKPPPPPPLVPPAALPSRRAVLGLSTAEDAVAWYRAAAAAGDPEGLFYLGWAHYHGLGVAENATFARMLWLRSFEVAGIRSTRALAPLLALAGMRIDSWLTPLLGPHALARGYAELLRGLGEARQWVTTHGSPAAAAAAGTGAGAGSGPRVDAGAGDATGGPGEDLILRVFAALDRGSAVLDGWWRQLVAAGGGVDAGNLENAVMLGLLAALLVVLVLRRRRMAGRT